METRNHYKEIKYGEGEKILTRDEALKHANGIVIPQLMNDSGLNIVGKPEIMEGKKEGLMYVKAAVKK